MVYLWHETNRSILSRKYQQNLERLCNDYPQQKIHCWLSSYSDIFWWETFDRLAFAREHWNWEHCVLHRLEQVHIEHKGNMWKSCTASTSPTMTGLVSDGRKRASAGMRAEVPLKYTRTSCHSDGVYFWQYSQKHARVPGSRLLRSSSCSSSYKDGNTSFVANTCKILPFGGFLVVAFFSSAPIVIFICHWNRCNAFRMAYAS